MVYASPPEPESKLLSLPPDNDVVIVLVVLADIVPLLPSVTFVIVAPTKALVTQEAPVSVKIVACEDVAFPDKSSVSI